MNAAIPQHSLVYGGILSILMFFFIFGSLYFNPELWLGDYPPDVREKYGPASEKTQRQKKWISIPFVLVLLGILIASLAQLPGLAGNQTTFPIVFLSIYIIFMVFNLVDLLVFDWLIALTIRPKFMILPGTEGLKGYHDYGFHFRGFLKGTLGGLLGSLMLAGVTILIYSL